MPQFNNIPDLIEYIDQNIRLNGVGAISGTVHNQVLRSIVTTLNGLTTEIPEDVIDTFPPWESAYTYQANSQVIVRHGGTLYLYVSSGSSSGIEPGTPSANGVWQLLNALVMSHPRNRDSGLDEGGTYAVTARQIREFMAAPTDGGAKIRFNLADNEMSGVYAEVIAGVPVAIGQVVRFGTDGRVIIADNASLENANVVGVAANAANVGEALKVVTWGTIRSTSLFGSLMPGVALYLSTSGTLTDADPNALASGRIAMKVGSSYGEGIVFVRPDLTAIQVS